MSKRLDKNGHETLSNEPMAIPAGFKIPETLAEQVQRLVRSSTIQHEAAQAGFETFEEADDFDVGDDFDPSTPYELTFDPILQKDISPDDFIRNNQQYKKQYEKALQEQTISTPEKPPKKQKKVAKGDTIEKTPEGDSD